MKVCRAAVLRAIRHFSVKGKIVCPWFSHGCQPQHGRISGKFRFVRCHGCGYRTSIRQEAKDRTIDGVEIGSRVDQRKLGASVATLPMVFAKTPS